MIKRDFSDSTTCTFLPGNSRQERVIEKYAETAQLYYGIQSIPRPTWMAQPFNRDLAQKGELRAFLVGGVLKYTVHTWPAGDARFHNEYVDNYTPLDLLQ